MLPAVDDDTIQYYNMCPLRRLTGGHVRHPMADGSHGRLDLLFLSVTSRHFIFLGSCLGRHHRQRLYSETGMPKKLTRSNAHSDTIALGIENLRLLFIYLSLACHALREIAAEVCCNDVIAEKASRDHAIISERKIFRRRQ